MFIPMNSTRSATSMKGYVDLIISLRLTSPSTPWFLDDLVDTSCFNDTTRPETITATVPTYVDFITSSTPTCNIIAVRMGEWSNGHEDP